MAYYKTRNTRYYNTRSNYGRRSGRRKYTQSENIAFRMGQEQRINECVKNGRADSRVYESYCKGYAGFSPRSQKPLF